MKIVQSLWSKPSMKNANIHITDRNNGGWYNKKCNYISWALSCLQFREFYDSVELVTDKLGYDLLINRLELPYTSVKVVLDDLNTYHPDLWSLGKLYAYSLQDAPFIHADGDIYIWQRFSEQLSQSQLLAQNEEVNFVEYSSVYESITQNFEFIPEVLVESVKLNRGIVGVNAGLLGGSDIEFFQIYTKQAIDFVEKNYDSLKSIDIGLFNIVFEQFLFHAMAEQKNYKIEYLIENMNKSYIGICELAGAPNVDKYAHALANYKKVHSVNSLIEYRLQNDYPEYYYRILNLLKTYQI